MASCGGRPRKPRPSGPTGPRFRRRAPFQPRGSEFNPDAPVGTPEAPPQAEARTQPWPSRGPYERIPSSRRGWISLLSGGVVAPALSRWISSFAGCVAGGPASLSAATASASASFCHEGQLAPRSLKVAKLSAHLLAIHQVACSKVDGPLEDGGSFPLLPQVVGMGGPIPPICVTGRPLNPFVTVALQHARFGDRGLAHTRGLTHVEGRRAP